MHRSAYIDYTVRWGRGNECKELFHPPSAKADEHVLTEGIVFRAHRHCFHGMLHRAINESELRNNQPLWRFSFAVLFYLRLALDDGNHLCENHCNSAIPAEYVADRNRTPLSDDLADLLLPLCVTSHGRMTY